MKLTEETRGSEVPEGKALTKPVPAVCVTVMLTEYPAMVAAAGNPGQAGLVDSGYVRVSPAAKIGPPKVPFAPRVSTTRHGVTPMNARGLVMSPWIVNPCAGLGGDQKAGAVQFGIASSPRARPAGNTETHPTTKAIHAPRHE